MQLQLAFNLFLHFVIYSMLFIWHIGQKASGIAVTLLSAAMLIQLYSGSGLQIFKKIVCCNSARLCQLELVEAFVCQHLVSVVYICSLVLYFHIFRFGRLTQVGFELIGR